MAVTVRTDFNAAVMEFLSFIIILVGNVSFHTKSFHDTENYQLPRISDAWTVSFYRFFRCAELLTLLSLDASVNNLKKSLP